MSDTLSFRFLLKRGSAFTLDVDEQVPLSGITAISGPSGSGKTTLVRALAGLDTEVTGVRQVRFAGTPWDDERTSVPPEERRVGMVFQEPALFPHLSVAVNVNYGAKRRGVTSTDAIIDALDLGRLMHRGVSGLSGGEARRVALARALASDPAIILLDEPMSGLDGSRKGDFLPYIARAVGAARVPAIYVSHSAEEVATLADRVLTLREGKSTGWDVPPMRLTGRVVGSEAGGMQVRINGSDDATISVPMRAFMGERIGLGLLPGNLMISTHHPGEGSAMGIFPARLVVDAQGRRSLSVFDQAIALPSGAAAPPAGEKLWLSILKVYPRPEPGDSQS
ncbi:MAG: ATP-binding cassette domain-containing protein [Pseudomonadota bacterium]